MICTRCRSEHQLRGKWCSSCQSEYDRTRRKRTPEENRARATKWYWNNRDRALERARRNYRENPQSSKAADARRRSKEKGAAIPFTKEQLVARRAYYGGRCWVCQGEATEDDHVKPLSKGGAHMLCNLRPICGTCNRRKRDKWPYLVVAA